MEAKKQGIGEEELSMEEILQSIRRIIADDDEGGGNPVSPETTNKIENPIPTSDILELTDMIADDGSITNLKEEPKSPTNNTTDRIDVLDNIDAALAPPPTPAPTPVAVAEPAPKVEIPVAVTQPNPQPSAPMPATTSDEISDGELDSLLSKAAQDATLSSLAKLVIPEEKKSYIHTDSPAFRSGGTVEDMVEDLLRPMLKEWLDNNLPSIVEKIVEREVVRLTRR